MLTALTLLALSAKPRFGAWVLLDGDGSSLASFTANVDCFDSATGQFYSCTKDGLVAHMAGIPADRFKTFVDVAHKHRVAAFGLIGDGGLGTAGVEYVLNDPNRRIAQAEALANMAAADHLEGVDLDYESMKAEDKDNFSAFVEVLADRLHRKHKLLAIALCAKDTEPGDWSGSQSEDYARIGKVVDRARIMTYDEHEESGPAGPVADIAWVQRVMDHTLALVPKEKIELGIPQYGYNWSPPKPVGINWTQFSALPGALQAGRDPVSQELLLTTADGGLAYFCDSGSERPKLYLASSLGLRGTYMWVTGSEDPKWWDVVREWVKS